jgi:universal stress protein E
MGAPARILVAIGAPGAPGAPPPGLARAAGLARAGGGTLCLAACVAEADGAGERFAESPGLAGARAALVAARGAQLEALAAPLRAGGLAVETAARWAYPAWEGLAGEAHDWRADLLVAAVGHHSPWHRTALTHSDWELVRASPCPVLLVRGPEAEPYRRILVPVDPMHAHDKPAALDDALIAAARALGAAGEASLRLLHCHLPPEYVPFRAPGAVAPEAFRRGEGSVAAHAAALRELAGRHGLPPGAAGLEAGDPREAIVEAAARQAADLVVMGAVARSRLRRLLVGSTAEAVMDRLACDVLAVKPSAA